MAKKYSRRSNRYHLTHHVIKLMRNRRYFSSSQCALCVYLGAPEVYPQQRKRIRQLLDKYVQAGLLERNDDLAACPIYRHREPVEDQIDKALVRLFEEHASRHSWSLTDKLMMGLLEKCELDRLAPANPDPADFMKDGRLLPGSGSGGSHYMWDRVEPEEPGVLDYLKKPA